MKARIEKKLSKRLVQLYPSLFGDAWRDDECSELAYKQRTSVRHVMSVGGGVDYWGDGEEAYTAWAAWTRHSYWTWEWHGPFDPYPEDHELADYPNTESFKPTTRNLLRLAAQCEAQRRIERNSKQERNQ